MCINFNNQFNPCSQAVVADRTVYVSGCLGMDKDGKLVSGGVVPETKKALENLGAVLDAAGSSYEKVVKTTIFVQNLEEFASVNEEYKKGACVIFDLTFFNKTSSLVFTKDFPARSSVQIAKLPLNAAVEIEAIALTGDVKLVSS